jgi:nucleoid-associated protein YgaU
MAVRGVPGVGLIAVTVGAGVGLSVVAPSPAALITVAGEIVREPQSTVDSQGVEAVALTVVAASAWLTLSWLGLAVLLIVAAALPGHMGAAAERIVAVLVPAATRRLLAGVLGVTLVTGAAGGAAAAPAAPAPAPTAIAALDLDWPVRRPAGAFTPTTQPGGPPPVADLPDARSPAAGGRPDHAEVVVHRGDTLWTIAARHLGPDATGDEIARAWPRWWAANHHVIGDDPDLITPGQRLIPPTAAR